MVEFVLQFIVRAGIQKSLPFICYKTVNRWFQIRVWNFGVCLRKIQKNFCYILTLDRTVNQRCTCENKRKKKRKQVDFMKEYRQMSAAVEFVGDRKARVRASLQTEGCGPQRPPVKQPEPRCGRSAERVLEDNTACYGRRGSWVNIVVCPWFDPSLTHHRNINHFENKWWEIYISINKRVRSFIEVCKSMLWILLYNTKIVKNFQLNSNTGKQLNNALVKKLPFSAFIA